MTYETKTITFHVIRVKVSSKSRCSRTLPMNAAIESARCGCEKFVQRLGLVKDVWKAWLNMIKVKALYQSMILGLSNLFLRAKCA